MSTDDDGGWALAFKNLVEDTYKINGNRKVVLISHSLGGPFTLRFLNNMTKDWKNKFIDSFVPIAAPFAGATKILRMFSSGEFMPEGTYLMYPLNEFDRGDYKMGSVIPCNSVYVDVVNNNIVNPAVDWAPLLHTHHDLSWSG